ncbi:hypothetical protein [Tunicatimonas pelagia]|uniref:hypothetical protein n=1 Tax=Tunicatimonas pelagia TaxID=931531 RepID=UPI002665F906|nr:hypothetical protein [Tunicatimonas pelagia]WKN46464.1 hypothetical protein P0M28_30405 [Tunicatimonas pelagia]
MNESNPLTESQTQFIMDVEITMREVDTRNITMHEGYRRLIQTFKSHITADGSDQPESTKEEPS